MLSSVINLLPNNSNNNNNNNNYPNVPSFLQAKAQEEAEKEQYRKFLAQLTAENFLKKVIYLQKMSSSVCG